MFSFIFIFAISYAASTATLPKVCSMQSRQTCSGAAAEPGSVCMWNGEDFICTSVEGDNNMEDWCKQYSFHESANCVQDPRCAWDMSDLECSENFIYVAVNGGTVTTTGTTTGTATATGTSSTGSTTGTTTASTTGTTTASTTGTTTASTTGTPTASTGSTTTGSTTAASTTGTTTAVSTGTTGATTTGASTTTGTSTGTTTASTGSTTTGSTTAASTTGTTTAVSTGTTGATTTGASTTTGTSTGSTVLMMPCAMRMMLQCNGPSPSGGKCYMAEGECEESEGGDGMGYMCQGEGPTTCGPPFCFWDASDYECTAAKEAPFGFTGTTTATVTGTATGPTTMGTVTGFATTGTTATGFTTTGFTTTGTTTTGTATIVNCEYLIDPAQCTAANGCFLKEYECKNLFGEAPEAPEHPEAPEGGYFGYGPQLTKSHGATEGKGNLNSPRPQEDSPHSSIPHTVLFGLAGFFGAMCVTLVVYSMTCANHKRTTRNDLFLDEFSIRV